MLEIQASAHAVEGWCLRWEGAWAFSKKSSGRFVDLTRTVCALVCAVCVCLCVCVLALVEAHVAAGGGCNIKTEGMEGGITAASPASRRVSEPLDKVAGCAGAASECVSVKPASASNEAL